MSPWNLCIGTCIHALHVVALLVHPWLGQIDACNIPAEGRCFPSDVLACSMTRFAVKADLEEFLNAIDPRYGSYADKLWDNGVASSSELANATVDLLRQSGVNMPLHAQNIIVQAAKGERQEWMCGEGMEIHESTPNAHAGPMHACTCHASLNVSTRSHAWTPPCGGAHESGRVHHRVSCMLLADGLGPSPACKIRA